MKLRMSSPDLLAGLALLIPLAACGSVHTASKAQFSQGSWPSGIPAAFCIDFSDSAVGLNHPPGDVILSNGRRVAVEAWPPWSGSAIVEARNMAGGTAPEAWSGSTLLAPDIATGAGAQTRFIELAIGAFGGSEALKVNGAYVGLPAGGYRSLTDPGVRSLGNVIYEFMPGAADPRVGHLRFRGFVESLAIGGQELAVDDICGWADDCEPIDSDLIESPFSTTVPGANPVAMDRTRGITARLLGNQHRVVVQMVLRELQLAPGSTAAVTARIYEDGSGVLVAEETTHVNGAAAPQDVRMPVQATLAPGASHVFAFHVDAQPPATIGYASKGGWGYHESEGVFVVQGPREGPGNAYPAGNAPNVFPLILVETVCR